MLIKVEGKCQSPPDFNSHITNNSKPFRLQTAILFYLTLFAIYLFFCAKVNKKSLINNRN